MSQVELKRISKEVIDRAEETGVPEKGLPKMVDELFIQRLKEEEMQHANVDARSYETLRQVFRTELLPLYELYRSETARVRERRLQRKVWQYILGSVGVCELIEAFATKGRSIAPGVLIPSAIFYSFIGFIIYVTAQYIDDLHLRRARRNLEKSIEALEAKAAVDATYDARRQLMDEDVLRSEALEILTHYSHPEAFWRDYCKVREVDPAAPGDLKKLNVPAFEKFLRFHVGGDYTEEARRQRFNRLFIEAHEILLSRDRDGYVLAHLKSRSST